MRILAALLVLLVAATAAPADVAACAPPSCPWNFTVDYHPTTLITKVSADPNGPRQGYVGLVHLDVGGNGLTAAGYGAGSPCDIWNAIALSNVPTTCTVLSSTPVYRPSTSVGATEICVSWAYLGIDVVGIPGSGDDYYTNSAVHAGLC